MKSLFSTIKPKSYVDNFKNSVTESVNKFLSLNPEMQITDCPFCLSTNRIDYFMSHTFIFNRCSDCNSIYNSKRPTESSLNLFYSLLPAEEIDTKLLPETIKIRKESIMIPRWQLLKNKLISNKVNFPVKKVLEVGAGMGHFLDVLIEDNCSSNYIAVEPSLAHQNALNLLPNTEIFSSNLEVISEKQISNCDLIFMNSVIEHPVSIENFFIKAHNFLKPGGILSIVDMHSGGLDIEIMRESAPNINPLFILQVGSVEGIRKLAERTGFELVDYFSMGQMDVDILFEYSQNISLDNPLSGFSYIFKNPEFRAEMQLLLKKYYATGYMGYFLKKI
jgi:SAM-dependent methyltransferase